MSKYFCIFGGGGIRGAAYSGVLRALKELNVEITGSAGSSVGAVVAGLISAGYNPDEIEDVFNNIDFSFFNDINLHIERNLALSKGENFLSWMKNKIESKFGKNGIPVCFKDLKNELVIFAADLNSSGFVEFSKAKTPDMEIALAIRISVGMPGLYSPVFLDNRCLADGDLLKIIPLWMVCDTIKSQKEKILEFRLENNTEKKSVSNTIEYLNAVYDTVSGNATDFLMDLYKNSNKIEYIKLNLKNTGVADFMINKQRKTELAEIGYETTLRHFKASLAEKGFATRLLNKFLRPFK